ncbi:hypothetical protein ACFE04_017118 [Oxalis oulophora]
MGHAPIGFQLMYYLGIPIDDDYHDMASVAHTIVGMTQDFAEGSKEPLRDQNQRLTSIYIVTGKIKQVDKSTLRVTELPIGLWTQTYVYGIATTFRLFAS